MILFGNRLRTLREDRDLTTEQIANELHITTRALNYYENNMREPSFPLLIQIADYLNVSTDYLLIHKLHIQSINNKTLARGYAP
jgi:transcriptional regulator with XRE-family HTH domain